VTTFKSIACPSYVSDYAVKGFLRHRDSDSVKSYI
jgi:hypothetical protein